MCCIAAIKRISHCQRFWIGGPRAYPNCRKVEGRFPAGLTFPLRLLAVADEVIDPNFRNASIEGGEVTLWVTSDRVEPAAGPAMSAPHPKATVGHENAIYRNGP